MRLSEGGLIDRDRTLRLRFDDRTIAAPPGDSLASALLANGIRLVGRSFKHHRPRGLLGAGAQQAGVGTVAERKAEGIQKDRLAGAGFPGEYPEAAVKGQVELLDNDDVADRQADQHSPIPGRH